MGAITVVRDSEGRVRLYRDGVPMVRDPAPDPSLGIARAGVYLGRGPRSARRRLARLEAWVERVEACSVTGVPQDVLAEIDELRRWLWRRS